MPAADTRANLLRAAESLFAQRGVDGVSLREIARSAGARNVIAVQYHFTDRDGVVRAILDKHLPAVDERRHALLDAADGDPTVRALAAALVRPLGAKLADTAGGPEFLRVYADLLNRPTPALEAADGRFASLKRWRSTLAPLLDPDAAKLHPRLDALLYTVVQLSRRAESGPHTDDRLFISHLIDVVAAILTAEVSDETRRLSGERDTRRARTSHT
ncbi:putative transcriptional regulator, TetR family protein [Mycolicibacterium murale]|uniref:Putative transcriptional regulator, TetR family protein n=1 Tax=Mycolicibacterium murale TaxID=182220 RepID=A0A7I9WGX1_9MYCO|nr:helix-turn-helix domain-containing protein [Mycolicibacterium murale]ANW66941.1 TetR family transcriptional regulator [Mycobacterium sp. djl-10]MCV7180741.1 TetR/AcrR family transcriptional regulator [Mycolicibacterium murale]GFG56964.1 putative transcriptional regulator, TetR family protein [Mycolicibacterium murale]